MSKKKKQKIHCIIFKKKFTKAEIKKWCYKNEKIIDMKTIENKKIIKVDGEYILYIRPKYKFKRTKKQYYKGVKIFKGVLK